MNGPIHSRGIGRSGPKRKTGCLTCRRRKVRCDEGRPVCANCIRLRLDCEFVPIKSKSSRTSPSTASSADTTSHRTSSFSLANSQQSTATHSSTTTVESIPITTYNVPHHQWTAHPVTTSSFPTHFSDSYLPSLESFDLGLGFSNTAEPFVPSNSYPDTTTTIPSNVPSNFNIHAGSDVFANEHDRCQKLLTHFTHSVDPTKLFQPTHTEWMSACRSLLSMANDCLYLLSAISSLSALHLCCTTGEDSYDEALRHYKLASREVNKILDNEMSNDRELKQAFAATFLCTYTELMAQTIGEGQPNMWPLHHLQGFHHRVSQHNDRIQTWTGVSKRLLTWTTLLQSKAEWNSANIALEQCSAPLAKYIGDPFSRDLPLSASGNDINVPQRTASLSDSEENSSAVNGESDMRSVLELAYDTINQPSYDFFLKSQAFTSRILGLEYYSQEHASMQMNFETLKDGQRISAELHVLWASRPSTMQFLRDPKSLEAAFQPSFARRVLLNLRVYTANFFAQFIHLHRVAFDGFPATADVQNAISRIIGLTKEIINAAPERRHSETLSPSTSSNRSVMNGATAANNNPPAALPAMMLWPLFLTCTECDASDRHWILETLRGMIQPTCPSIARTVYLLEELLRRQDQEGRRIDHRAIRREIFDGDLSTIY